VWWWWWWWWWRTVGGGSGGGKDLGGSQTREARCFNTVHIRALCPFACSALQIDGQELHYSATVIRQTGMSRRSRRKTFIISVGHGGRTRELTPSEKLKRADIVSWTIFVCSRGAQIC